MKRGKMMEGAGGDEGDMEGGEKAGKGIEKRVKGTK